MATWFTSDHHFGHDNIRRYCSRPFPDVHQMDRELMKRWNDTIAPGDLVYYLGDLCFKSKKQEVVDLLKQLNGTVILLKGNHDQKTTRKAVETWHEDLPLEIGQFKCILAHRPLYPTYIEVPERDRKINLERMERYSKYSFVISGHVHEKRLWTGKSLNVGVDQHDFYPISEERVLALLVERYETYKKEIFG